MEQNIPSTLYPDQFSNSGVISMLVTQSGTAAPTAVYMKKTIGDAVPTFARSAAGTYTMTLNGAFPAGKVVAPGGVINVTTGAGYDIARTSDNVLTIRTATIGGALADGLLNNTPILIYVKRS